ncbi:slipin family protein [Tsukamurella sp. 8F]|uniref:slipin family protein n=1 Tax=unclassified Tsukamurella TaxID=2633480 RepID=UPI0023B901F5|nr:MULTISPECIES: slipin family protein [unclassified Tsukamurella]MDF0532556.1 slipin family protein [Tsukamurella sp. 8J]MDF0589481.1 slipin family protein [Tsukamurella sp. 8F]
MSFLDSIFGTPLTVPVGHVVLEYRAGAPVRLMEPGRHRVRDMRGLVSVRMREYLLSVAPQEIPTAESVAIRVSMTLRVAVTDPIAYTERAVDPDAVVYLAAQIALRDTVVGVPVEELLRRGDAVDTAPILEAAREAGSGVGLEVRSVVVKDIVLPSEIRSAAVDLVTAKARGAARLEEARAETAALRALANAGRMLDASPALASLRMIQAAPVGAKVVMAVGDGAAQAAE